MEDYFDRNRRRPQDALPYEQRMKNIIRHYRWLLQQNERLADYARKLERKIESQKEKMACQGATNKKISEKATERSRKIKRLEAHIEWLEEKLKQYDGEG